MNITIQTGDDTLNFSSKESSMFISLTNEEAKIFESKRRVSALFFGKQSEQNEVFENHKNVFFKKEKNKNG